jgi:hypothetical protein
MQMLMAGAKAQAKSQTAAAAGDAPPQLPPEEMAQRAARWAQGGTAESGGQEEGCVCAGHLIALVSV